MLPELLFHNLSLVNLGIAILEYACLEMLLHSLLNIAISSTVDFIQCDHQAF